MERFVLPLCFALPPFVNVSNGLRAGRAKRLCKRAYRRSGEHPLRLVSLRSARSAIQGRAIVPQSDVLELTSASDTR